MRDFRGMLSALSEYLRGDDETAEPEFTIGDLFDFCTLLERQHNLLKYLEWDIECYCPVCGHDGTHHSSCELNKVLTKVEESQNRTNQETQ